MGHVFQSGAIGFGHGLFLTISPNEKMSSLVLRLHRVRQQDPLLRAGSADESMAKMRQRLASRDLPSLSTDLRDQGNRFRGCVFENVANRTPDWTTVLAALRRPWASGVKPSGECVPGLFCFARNNVVVLDVHSGFSSRRRQFHHPLASSFHDSFRTSRWSCPIST